MAVGLTLTFGVMRMVNFAEGQSVMIGAFVAFTATPFIGYVPAILIAMLVNAGLGVVLERTAFRPFRGMELNGLIASMGMSIILVNLAELTWGTTPRSFDTAMNSVSVTIGTVGVSVQRLVIIGASVCLLGLLWWFVQHSSLGRQFRAVSRGSGDRVRHGDRHASHLAARGRLRVHAGGRRRCAHGSGQPADPGYGPERDAERLRGDHPGRVRQRQRNHHGRADHPGSSKA